MTGSRPVEILKVSSYLPVTDKPDYVRVVGVAKDRTDAREIVKPIMYGDFNLLMKLISNIRANISPDLSNTQIASNYNTALNGVLHEYFPYDDPKHHVTMKVVRAAYAFVSYQEFTSPAQKLQKNINSWTSEVLGHSRKSISVSLNYSAFAMTSKTNSQLADTKVLQANLSQYTTGLYLINGWVTGR